MLLLQLTVIGLPLGEASLVAMATVSLEPDIKADSLSCHGVPVDCRKNNKWHAIALSKREECFSVSCDIDLKNIFTGLVFQIFLQTYILFVEVNNTFGFNLIHF